MLHNSLFLNIQEKQVEPLLFLFRNYFFFFPFIIGFLDRITHTGRYKQTYPPVNGYSRIRVGTTTPGLRPQKRG